MSAGTGQPPREDRERERESKRETETETKRQRERDRERMREIPFDPRIWPVSESRCFQKLM